MSRWSGTAPSRPSAAGRIARSESPASCRSGTRRPGRAARCAPARTGAGPSPLSETHSRSVRAVRARFPPPPTRSSRCPAAPGSDGSRTPPDCRNCAAGAPSRRVRCFVRSAAAAAFRPVWCTSVTCARASRSSSRRKRSRSPDTAGGSTTHPPRITTSRPLASISGGGPGACTRESSAPAKNSPSRQQTPASTRDPRHSARHPRSRNAAIARNDSDGPSGRNR